MFICSSSSAREVSSFGMSCIGSRGGDIIRGMCQFPPPVPPVVSTEDHKAMRCQMEHVDLLTLGLTVPLSDPFAWSAPVFLFICLCSMLSSNTDEGISFFFSVETTLERGTSPIPIIWMKY